MTITKWYEPFSQLMLHDIYIFISFLMSLPAMLLEIASTGKPFITEKTLLSLQMFTLMTFQTCPGDKSGLTLETFVVQILFSDFSLKEMQFFGMNFSLVTRYSHFLHLFPTYVAVTHLLTMSCPHVIADGDNRFATNCAGYWFSGHVSFQMYN